MRYSPSFARHKSVLRLLLTCRSVYSEAHAIFYVRQTLRFTTPAQLYHCLSTLAPRRRAHVVSIYVAGFGGHRTGFALARRAFSLLHLCPRLRYLRVELGYELTVALLDFRPARRDLRVQLWLRDGVIEASALQGAPGALPLDWREVLMAAKHLGRIERPRRPKQDHRKHARLDPQEELRENDRVQSKADEDGDDASSASEDDLDPSARDARRKREVADLDGQWEEWWAALDMLRTLRGLDPRHSGIWGLNPAAWGLAKAKCLALPAHDLETVTLERLIARIGIMPEDRSMAVIAMFLFMQLRMVEATGPWVEQLKAVWSREKRPARGNVRGEGRLQRALEGQAFGKAKPETRRKLPDAPSEGSSKFEEIEKVRTIRPGEYKLLDAFKLWPGWT